MPEELPIGAGRRAVDEAPGHGQEVVAAPREAGSDSVAGGITIDGPDEETGKASQQPGGGTRLGGHDTEPGPDGRWPRAHGMSTRASTLIRRRQARPIVADAAWRSNNSPR